MAAVSQKIPNLLGGVSQQPDPVKLPGQVREAENIYLDPTFGCRKRPGTELVAQLATDVPRDSRWFPIFRDNNERYAVALYEDPDLVVRVWDLNDGTERTVTISKSAKKYFKKASKDSIEQLTIADYTLLSNVERVVSMSSKTSDITNNKGLVTVNQVAYNTNYSIDIGGANNDSQEKIHSATEIEVIPGSFEEDDDGACTLVNAQNFQVDDGDKTGLSFRLVNQCQAYLGGEDYKEYKVDKVTVSTTQLNQTIRPLLEDKYGNYRSGTIDEEFDSFTVRWKYDAERSRSQWSWSVREREWLSNNPNGKKKTGEYGTEVRISDINEKYESTKRYISRYTVDAILQNGGQGWRKGDEATVTMDGREYTIRVKKSRFTYASASIASVSFTTPTDTESGALDLGLVVSSLASAVNDLDGFEAQSVGNVIQIVRENGKDFNLSVRGGTVNQAMTAIKGSARDVADLPDQCFDQFVLKVNNTDDSDADDYYVKFETSSPGVSGTGSWVECVAPGMETTINSSTMPHALVRQADGSFTLDALDGDSAFGGWASREVGDDVSNPTPSFVGKGISNMFFFSNRLGFLSEDAVVMSQPGDYFNFFVVSALTVSDADPIDLTASSTKPAILKAAVGSPKGLILFAETSQFLLASSEIAFSASTVKLTEISNYFYKSRVLPLNSGVSVSFISESATYSKVMEMAVDSVENRPVVADITRVIPEYLPPNFEWGEVMPNNNMLVFGNNSREVYVFKFFNNGEERQLAGWTRWVYPAECHMFATEDDLAHIVLYDGAQHLLCTSKMIDDPDDAPLDVGFSKFTPRLDAIIPKDDVTITTEDPRTKRITLPAKILVPGVTYNLVVIKGQYEGQFVRPELVDDNALIVDKKLANAKFVIGLQYESKVTLPSLFINQEGRADRVNIPQVTFLYLDLYYSGRYQIDIEKLGYDVTSISAEQTTSNVYDLDATPISEINTISVPIFSRGDIVKTTVTSPDPFPSSITGYSWEGSYNNRGISAIR